MTNIIISLDDDLARKARVEAAKLGKSLSRYTSELLRERLERPSQSEALERFLAGPPLTLSDENGNLPQGRDRYEPVLLRHEYPDLRPRSEEPETGGL